MVQGRTTGLTFATGLWAVLSSLLVGGGLICPNGVYSQTNYSLQRYQVILDKQPFGKPPPEPKTRNPSPKPEPKKPERSFARLYRMTAIVNREDKGFKVGLVHKQKNKSYMIAEGETQEGLRVVKVDPDKEEAVIEKGDQMALLKLKSGNFETVSDSEQPPSPGNRSGRTRSSNPRPDPRERFRQKTNQMRKAGLTGEALEKHLQEQNMKAIREGQPPLPIPLTPEQDKQLVREGHLPPRD